jgi:hypothetical protein
LQVQINTTLQLHWKSHRLLSVQHPDRGPTLQPHARKFGSLRCR